MECAKRLFEKPEKLKPQHLLEVLDSVSVSQHAKEQLVKDILAIMRQDKYDIRGFNLN